MSDDAVNELEKLKALFAKYTAEEDAIVASLRQKIVTLREAAELVEQELEWANDHVLSDFAYRKESGDIGYWDIDPAIGVLRAAIEASK